ncbi:MAG TPA: glycosyl hydrolase [Cyanobacteria bacterium UBA8803]|nr:glycosyl hydrolase [Cyanobacteria bacterium UBA9273]HBL57044.1 glycosyl hydrolase [Cyanobacteria bacterium UBA8803]
MTILSPLGGCVSISFQEPPQTPSSPLSRPTSSPIASSSPLPVSTANQDILEQSWDIYRKQFIQEDGRVIDYQASDRSTSEGQAYAMLRAVIVNDPNTFDLTLTWAEDNLHRLSAKGEPTDQLWVWLWGKQPDGTWGPIDRNFASDADIDAITALILAARRWNRPEYLDLARLKLRDLWEFSTFEVPGGKRYLLPGPKEAFVPSPATIYLNPSYLAPYAFRLFAQVDPDRNWLSLVESSYQVLEKSSKVSAAGLPSDWIALDTKTGQFQPMPANSKLQSVYSFDAYRVWWRVAWDAQWFESPEALRYLKNATQHLQKLWRSSSRIPARIDLQGKSSVNYDATSQYAMLYPALRLIDPTAAQQLLEQNLLPRYNEGIWDDESAYYTQNLAWLGLLPAKAIDPKLLKPQ